MKEKMDFEEFKKIVVNEIRKYLPEEYTDASIVTESITKNNDTKLTALIIRKKGVNIAPTIYIDEYYQHYSRGGLFEDILQEIATIRIENDVECNFEIEEITDFENCKHKILPRLINAAWNESLLDERPHILMADLAVVFYIELLRNSEGVMSVGITYGIADTWSVSTEELYQIAIDNLTAAHLGKIDSMKNVIRELLLPDVPELDYRDEAEALLRNMLPPEDKIYIVTNKDRNLGACELLDKVAMQEIIEKVGENFFVLPSSIHECLIVATNNDEFVKSYLEDLVRTINCERVDPRDRLSDNIYRYDKERGLKLA